jgi:hypothetical protein
MTNKREQIAFKKGDQCFSPDHGLVTIVGVRGYGNKKEFAIEVEGEKVWYLANLLRG